MVEIARPEGSTPAALAAAEADTVAAMQAGVDVVFQASFFDGRLRAHADFLLRIEEPSTLGPWRYDVADTKLARRAKPAALLQMAAYAEQVERIQGVAPAVLEVVTGDGERSVHPSADVSAYYRATRARFEAVVDGPPDDSTYPDPVPHCAVCPWSDACEGRRRADDHLSLVAGMRAPTALRLAAAGIDSVADLATMGDDVVVRRVGPAFRSRLRNQARLQRRAHDGKGPRYALLPPPRAGLGLEALPAPSPGDMFLDLEGDPWASEGGLEYLWGVVTVDTGTPVYEAFWGHDAVAEQLAFETVIDRIVDRRRRWPDMHVYHYAPYELTAMKRLAGRHVARQPELDGLLRSGAFVDLYAVVRHGIRVSQEGYGLKKLEAYYLEHRPQDGVGDGANSIVVYEEWLETADPQLLADIEAYNELDCLSTLGLRNWLEARRDEVAATAGIALGRRGDADGRPSENVEADDTLEAELRAALTRDIPDDPDQRAPAQQATWLLAQLVGFHRREQKPEWWAYYDRCTRTDSQLVDDSEAIGELTDVGPGDKIDRSVLHHFRFDPDQEHKVRQGSDVHDPRTRNKAGSVHRIDGRAGVLVLKRSRNTPIPTSIVPAGPVTAGELPRSVARVADSVLADGIDGPGPFRAVRDLLLGLPPRLSSPAPSGHPANLADVATDRALRLDGGCLAIQGPPGSGKTYTGAQLIVALARAGRTVGISGPSHKAIANLLDAVCRRAESDGGPALQCLQKTDDDSVLVAHAFVEKASNGDIETAMADAERRPDVVAGTAWLFSRPALVEAFDVLVIDEAGQVPLATTVSVGAAARNLVLLGDPQQLRQPGKGVHPPGSDVSALGHLMGDRATLDDDLGLFLDQSYRMHPEVCSFISELAYDGRLGSIDACARQDLIAPGALTGTGLRWIPVAHQGNRTRSDEEVDAIVGLVADLLGATFVDRVGQARVVTLDDILVVAPYNAQVNRLIEALPDGARVGTVDRFQGQEAPIVLCSLAASSTDDAPRGPSFLLDRHRLNVAVSRAQVLAGVVASPTLLATRCTSARQVPLVNALCRFVEVAQTVR